MKDFIISTCISYIKKQKEYPDIEIEKIKYGLESIYLTISKVIIISIIAAIIGIFKEMIVFLLIYNIIRMPSFGLHATKSWICLVSSTIIFIGIPFICIYLNAPIYIKIVVATLAIIFMFKNSPADTYKKPIVSKKRRCIYKYISTLITILFSFISILINNNFLSNCFLFSIVLQNFMISPTVYKVFGLPYNNYIGFLKNHPGFAE